MKLSAVIQLLDGYSKQPVTNVALLFLLNGKPCQPLCKASAFYAFHDLDGGDYRLSIVSIDHIYFDQEIRFQVPLRLPLAQAIEVVYLAPSPLYSYPDGTTLIYGKVMQTGLKKNPLAGVNVTATYNTVRSKGKSNTTLSFDFNRYAGLYLLALAGQLPEIADVNLSFSKAGMTTVQKQIRVQPGTLQCVDIEM